MSESTTETLMDYPMLSETLGIKQATLEYWVSRREIPFYRLGRLVRFKPSEIAEWMDARRVEGAR